MLSCYYIFLLLFVGLSPLLILQIYSTTKKSKTPQTNKKRRNRKPQKKSKPTEDYPIPDLKTFINKNSLNSADAAKIIELIFNQFPENSRAQILPKSDQVIKLTENINSLNNELIQTNEKHSRAVSEGKILQENFENKIEKLTTTLEKMQNDLKEMTTSHNNEEKKITTELTESVSRLKECLNQNIETETISDQIEQTKRNGGWEEAQEAERRIKESQEELMLANRKMVVANNRLGSLTALLEGGKKTGEAHDQMNEKLLIKEARNVHLTNVVAQLKIEVLYIEKKVEETRQKLKCSQEMLESMRANGLEESDVGEIKLE